MKYYQLNNALDNKVIGRGSYPQTKGVYTRTIEDPNYIFNAFKRHSKIDQEVEVPQAQLRAKSTKLTDLLSGGGYGFQTNLLVSDLLKQILEKSKQIGLQFFKTTVFDFSGEHTYSYWLSNVFIFFPEYADYQKSELLTDTWDEKGKEIVSCNSFEDYEIKGHQYAPRRIYLNKIVFLNDEIEYDFFALDNVFGGPNYYVSEKLKNEIEENGCTGIFFTAPDQVYP